MKKAIIFIVFLTAMLAGPAGADIVLISNNTVITDSVTKDQVKKIFLGDMTKWSEGTSIKFVIMNKSDVHKEFVKQYTRKSTSQFQRYWKHQVFTGKGSIPKSFNTESELIDYVAKTEGAIGYVSSKPTNDSIKVIIISD